MSIITKLNRQAQQTNKENKEQVISDLFINIGIPVVIDDKDTFVNIPLTLTADRLEEILEKQAKLIGANSPDSWVELVEGRIALGEAVMKLFNALDKGQAVTASEIDPENPDFGFLANLEIQFAKRSETEERETSGARQTVLSKFHKFNRK